MTLFIIVYLALLFLLGLYMLQRSGLLNDRFNLVFSVLFLLGAISLRFCLLDYESDDYISFLAPWTEFFRSSGGFRALAYELGNYNPPYLYFLALFSYFNINELYLIKLLSITFDVLLAWACMRLVSVFENSELNLAFCFFAVLLFPTVILNSAYWGQCDSIYCFFAVYSLYLALKNRPVGAMLCITASFAFKLQAVFLMPMFFVLLVAKKIRFKHLFIFPAAYVVYMLPAIIAGRPFLSTITLYFKQAETVGSAMNYNAPSLTAMFRWNGDTQMWSNVLIIAAFALVLIVFAISILKRSQLNDEIIFAFAVLMAIAIPFFLPHMHDRYFFLPGVLAISLAMSNLKLIIIPVLAELASLHCYYAYFTRHYLVNPRVGGLLMLAALIMAAANVIAQFKNSKNSEINP